MKLSVLLLLLVVFFLPTRAVLFGKDKDKGEKKKREKEQKKKEKDQKKREKEQKQQEGKKKHKIWKRFKNFFWNICPCTSHTSDGDCPPAADASRASDNVHHQSDAVPVAQRKQSALKRVVSSFAGKKEPLLTCLVGGTGRILWNDDDTVGTPIQVLKGFGSNTDNVIKFVVGRDSFMYFTPELGNCAMETLLTKTGNDTLQHLGDVVRNKVKFDRTTFKLKIGKKEAQVAVCTLSEDAQAIPFTDRDPLFYREIVLKKFVVTTFDYFNYNSEKRFSISGELTDPTRPVKTDYGELHWAFHKYADQQCLEGVRRDLRNHFEVDLVTNGAGSTIESGEQQKEGPLVDLLLENGDGVSFLDVHSGGPCGLLSYLSAAQTTITTEDVVLRNTFVLRNTYFVYEGSNDTYRLLNSVFGKAFAKCDAKRTKNCFYFTTKDGNRETCFNTHEAAGMLWYSQPPIPISVSEWSRLKHDKLVLASLRVFGVDLCSNNPDRFLGSERINFHANRQGDRIILKEVEKENVLKVDLATLPTGHRNSILRVVPESPDFFPISVVLSAVMPPPTVLHPVRNLPSVFNMLPMVIAKCGK